MTLLKLTSTQSANRQFIELRKRAAAVGQLDYFMTVHNEILASLRDLDKALEVGERLYHTRKQGGEVRHWVYEFVSVSYVVFPNELAGWITKYLPVPASWPD